MNKEDFAKLRPGDKVLIEATFTAHYAEKSARFVLPSRNDIVVHHHDDIVRIEKFGFRVGDRCEWMDGGDRRTGKILGLEKDPEPSANGRVWAWIKDDHRWARVTLDTANINRI